MLVSTTTIVAIRCPVCGKMDFHALSLFSFAGKKAHRVTCSCGAGLMSLGSKDQKRFWLQVNCVMCESKHISYHQRRQLWSNQLTALPCEETGVDIGFIGPRNLVKASILNQDKSLQEMAEDLGFVDYFENPEIMYEILEHLHQVAEDGHLYCQCGSYQINVEVYPDRLELRCENCDAIGMFYAENDNDLDTMQRFSEIRITGQPFFAESKPVKKGRRRSKK